MTNSHKVIDSHQHFWKLDRGDYNWLDKSFGILYQDYNPADLKPYLGAANVEQTILVQAAQTIEETEFMLSLADRNEFIGGVVGWVDLEAESVITDIARLARHSKLKGVRPMIQDIEGHQWIANTKLSPAIDALVHHNLRFDALVTTQHIDSLIVMMNRHPSLPVVIDHGAKPPIKSGNLNLWRQKIREISSHQNVYCKLSGLLTECGENPSVQEITPVFEHLMTCFGPDRLIWGSDWPVVRLRAEYGDWLSMTNDLISELPAMSQRKIMSSNAKHFYGLN